MKQTVLITGASSGIGKAAAKKFAAEGWQVIATMRSPEKEQELTQLPNVLVTKLDVQHPATIDAAIQKGIAHFGQIDVLVNNAGYGQFGIFEATTEEQVRQQFEVNVFGVMHVTRVVLPRFRQRKTGLILNISSGAGRFTLPTISLYAASKFALEGFSEALSFELSAVNIGVKIIEPGGTVTNFGNTVQTHFAQNAALADYQPFLQAAGKMFEVMQNERLATAEEVAQVIYTAATDGTPTLRYAVGNEDFKKRIAARASMPDEAYLDFIRKGYTQYME